MKMKMKNSFRILALAVLFSLAILPVAHAAGRELAELKKLEELKKGAKIMELRLYIKGGRIVCVEPIKPENYVITPLKELIGENIAKATTVLIRQDNPTCTYWYYYWSGKSWEKICLRW
ncbi:MAG: hypothetical protein HWN68_18610 [Desulfobacterales bacterium]|nr:hypothetical protein [Desulfobacterales bacterium]